MFEEVAGAGWGRGGDSKRTTAREAQVDEMGNRAEDGAAQRRVGGLSLQKCNEKVTMLQPWFALYLR